ITNVGKDSMTLMKDPRGLLSPFPTNKFIFTNDKDKTAHPKFIGTQVKYAPSVTTPDSYTSLSPGESLQVMHDLSKAYDFSELPPGPYNVTGNYTFYQVNKTGVIWHITPDSTSGKRPDITTTLSTGPLFINCTDSQEQDLVAAAQVAQGYAASASLYASSVSGWTSRYSTWFGLYSKSRHSLVTSQFSAISGSNFSTFTYDCSCTMSNVYAYVYPNDFGRVYLCGAFWQAPMNGTDSKGGTLVHETSHFVVNAGGTEDYAYGQSSCKLYSLLYPSEAVKNADSHEYFAENNPPLA
ncbi:hypothetical protein HYPSUDRAFT_149751, partial [Hypholoma sublateritium FD-334 SS-4]